MPPEPAEEVDMSGLDTQMLLDQAAKANEVKNPLDPVVNKLAEKGYDSEGAFDILDDNMDGVLTIKEIKDGMAHMKISLTDDEWD